MINFYSIEYLKALANVSDISAEGHGTFEPVPMKPFIAGTVTVSLENGYRLTSEKYLSFSLINLGIPRGDKRHKTTTSFSAEVYNQESTINVNKFFKYELDPKGELHQSKLEHSQFIDEINNIIGKELCQFLLERHSGLEPQWIEVELNNQHINTPQLTPTFKLISEQTRLSPSNIDESLQSTNEYAIECCKLF